jgi:hypothetical protein
VVQIPEGSERPQGAGYGSLGAAIATETIAAITTRSFMFTDVGGGRVWLEKRTVWRCRFAG